MGFSPVQIDQMSLGQWVAVAQGWAKTHAEPDAVEPPSVMEFEAAVIAARSVG